MQNPSYAFVVRVWLESADSDGKSAIWRGSIEQIGSNCTICFSELDEITRYIQTQIDLKEHSSTSGLKLAMEHLKDGFKTLWNRLLHRNS